jgi:multidrug efflux system outer membrane protein
MPTFRPFFTLVLASGLSACTMIPTTTLTTLPVSSRFPGASSGVSGHASELAWQQVFTDPRLKKILSLALANNRDLRVALLNVERSRAQYRVTNSASYPGVNAEGSYSHSRSNGRSSDQWNASLASTAYELDLFGRVRSLNEQALQQYLATAEAGRAAQISLIAEIATRYLSIRQAEEQLQLAHQTLAAVQGSYDLNKARLDAGESNELDFRSAEGQVQTAKINAITYERQIAQDTNALVLLAGTPLPANLPAPRSLNDSKLIATIPVGLPSDLLTQRPDIIQAERTLLAANANIGAARAAFFPKITLTASAGTSSSDFSKLLGSGTGGWNFSPQISVPIFDEGQNQANLDVAKISSRIEIANYEKSIQTAFREVADALFSSSSYAKQADAQASLIGSQQKRFDLANDRYLQGEDSYLNVLTAQQDLYNAQQGRIDARYNQLVSQVSLYKALGGGWK